MFDPSHTKKHRPAPSAATGSQNADSPLRRLSLVRGQHRWTFACDERGRAALLSTLEDLARAPDCPLDRFDICLIERHLTPRKKAA